MGAVSPPAPSWRSSPIRLVVPEAVARAMLTRARRLDVGLGGRYLVRGERVDVWPHRGSEDEEPMGSFAFAWGDPGGGRVALHRLRWDATRCAEADLRRAIAALAARLGSGDARAALRAGSRRDSD